MSFGSLLLVLCLVPLVPAFDWSKITIIPPDLLPKNPFAKLANLNTYLDGVLVAVKPFLSAVDPMKLPAMELFGYASPSASLEGLSSVYRVGESSITPTAEGSLKVHVSMGFKNLTFKSNFTAIVAYMKFPVDLAANLLDVIGTAEFSLPLLPTNRPKVSIFGLEDIGNVTVKIGHLGPFNKWAGNWSAKTLKETLLKTLGNPLLDQINEAIDKISISNLMKLFSF